MNKSELIEMIREAIKSANGETPLQTSQDQLDEKGRCWKNYEPVPGKKPYSKDSCRLIKKNESSESDDVRNKVKEVVKGMIREIFEEQLDEGRTADKKGYKSKKGGLTAKGRAAINRKTGSNLKAPVTKAHPTGKERSRRNSFCARMSGMKGPMKKPNGEPTRKAKALSRWKCRRKKK